MVISESEAGVIPEVVVVPEQTVLLQRAQIVIVLGALAIGAPATGSV